VVVDIGDWWDMPSLFMFDRGARGRRQFEGRRYWLDIEAGIDAMERVRYQLDTYNRGKKAPYRPRFIRTLGNHEERIARAVEYEPRFENLLGYHDLMSQEFGWEEFPPGEPACHEGVWFVHSIDSTGVNIPNLAIRGQNTPIGHRSSAHGHTHRRGVHEEGGPDGRLISVNVGCYFDYPHTWLPLAKQERWWYGLTWLRDVRSGQFDVEFENIDEVRRKYA
jgi:hypothetical protein